MVGVNFGVCLLFLLFIFMILWSLGLFGSWGVFLSKPLLVDSGFLVVGSRVSNVSLSRLRRCSYFRQLLWGYASARRDYSVANTCSLSSCHCDFNGIAYKFTSRVGGFFTVSWVCPKLAGLVVSK